MLCEIDTLAPRYDPSFGGLSSPGDTQARQVSLVLPTDDFTKSSNFDS